MLFTWDTANLCIVFRQWHVRGTASLIFSLLAIVAICAGYEAMREATRRFEAWTEKQDEVAGPSEFSSLPLPSAFYIPPHRVSPLLSAAVHFFPCPLPEIRTCGRRRLFTRIYTNLQEGSNSQNSLVIGQGKK